MLNETMDSTSVNIMTVTGTGQISVTPDLAKLHLGVQTIGNNLVKIQNENARITQQIIDELGKYNITDLRTYQYTVQKLYDYVNGNQIDKGFTVRNMLEIKTNDLTQVGSIIDTAVETGSNLIELVEFEVSDPNSHYLIALDLAINNAFQKASVIANSLGVTTTPVPIRVDETSTVPIPYGNFARYEGAISTPIEAGSKEIIANVIMKFLY